MSGTSAIWNTKALSIGDVLRAKDALEAATKDTEWFLVSPDGLTYKGSPQELIIVLAPHHPLLKR